MPLTQEAIRQYISDYFDLMDERPELFPMKDDLVLDPGLLAAYSAQTKKPIGVVYKSDWHYLIVDVVADEFDRPLYPYERYVTRSTQPGAVIIPHFADGTLCMLEHYRHTLGETLLEFPRGFGKDGESGWEAAVREMAEEIGAAALEFSVIGQIVADSGINGDRITVVEATIDSYDVEEGYEDIDGVAILTRPQLADAISKGEVVDGFTLSAIALLNAKEAEELFS